MKISKKLIYLVLFFSLGKQLEAEQVPLIFHESSLVSPFERVVQHCMLVQEDITRLGQSDNCDEQLIGQMCGRLVQLHAQCVRMGDSAMVIIPEDIDYLSGWFDRLNKQGAQFGCCPCMSILLNQSQKLLTVN